MKLYKIIVMFLILSLCLTGCQKRSEVLNEPEPSATYDWMAGVSPVANRRMGVVRGGLNLFSYAVSPSGIYFIPRASGNGESGSEDPSATYILYADHGSNRLNKLCGRTDCSHNASDCNAYLYYGSDIHYHQGNLYAVSGEGSLSEECKLIRMAPDGSQHKAVFDLLEYTKKQGGDYVYCDKMINGYCIFSIYRWEDADDGSYTGVWMKEYKYKLDGSMKEPTALENVGSPLYQCGDLLLALSGEAKNGQEINTCWSLDLETETQTYLTEHPGIPGWFGSEEAYYFKDGCIVRLNYASAEEEILLDTGLEGSYYLFSLPECLVLASQDSGEEADDKLYFYNWAFELVDTVELDFPLQISASFSVFAETADRLFMTDDLSTGFPQYYIEKSELGTGNVQLHEYQYE